MFDGKIIKKNLNDRLKEIDTLVDKYLPNDKINEYISKYSEELEGYKYIETLEEFSLLKPRGKIKYINKYDGNLRHGGLLLKVYKSDGNWIASIMQFSGKKYYVSFKSNYIFYTQNTTFTSWAKCFIQDCDKGLYEIE